MLKFKHQGRRVFLDLNWFILSSCILQGSQLALPDFATTKVQHRMQTQNHPADTGIIPGSTQKCAHGKRSCSLTCMQFQSSVCLMLWSELQSLFSKSSYQLDTTALWCILSRHPINYSQRTMVSLIKVRHVCVCTHRCVGGYARTPSHKICEVRCGQVTWCVRQTRAPKCKHMYLGGRSTGS